MPHCCTALLSPRRTAVTRSVAPTAGKHLGRRGGRGHLCHSYDVRDTKYCGHQAMHSKHLGKRREAGGTCVTFDMMSGTQNVVDIKHLRTGWDT